MTWLPSLRYGEHRWWLPLTAAAASHWSEIALRKTAGDHAGAIQAAVRLLREDLPSRIWCAIGWSDDLSLNRSITLALTDAAHWLLETGLRSWLCHDRLLGAPTPTPAMINQWSTLASHQQHAPNASQTEVALRWLRATGPQVSDTWSCRWPTLALDFDANDSRTDSDAHPFSLATLPVAILVRQSNELESLQSRFQLKLQTAKTESIYHVAYGLSHELNNPLSNISGRAQTLLSKCTEPSQQRPLQAILDQTQRGFEMIADLMYVARPPEPVTQKVNLEAWLKSAAESLQKVCDSLDIQLSINNLPNASPISIAIDPLMLGDALRAVVRNSIEALDEGGEIRLWIEHQSQATEIHIADNGPGIPESLKPFIFEPYFSGREAGRGLGMGLCKARRIMEQLGGTIEVVDSVPGSHVCLRLGSRV